MTSDNKPFEDNRLRGVSAGEYFRFDCGKCGAIVGQLKYRKTPSGPFLDYQCNECPNKGTLKLRGVVLVD